MIRAERKARLERLFLAGVEQCRAATVLPRYLPKTAPKGRTIILGAGKAAADMASVAVTHLTGPVIGCVVTRYGHGADIQTGAVEVLEAGHPTPDENSALAADKIMRFAADAGAGDRVIFLISGGGSALLTRPIAGLSLGSKQEITRCLLKSGAPISDINFVRTHLSAVKGGGLAAIATPAEQFTFIISDVVGDTPEAVASGPTLATERDPERAIDLLRKYNCPFNRQIADAIRAAAKVNPPALHETRVIATNSDALTKISSLLEGDGWVVRNLGAGIEGEASEIGYQHAQIAHADIKSGERVAIISGGELTVRVDVADGRGGPNLEYLAALAESISPGSAYSAIACDSDGIDGTEDNAGAYIDGESLSRFQDHDVDVASLRRAHRTYDLFKASNDLVITGPTRTNVNDIRILLVNDDDAIAA